MNSELTQGKIFATVRECLDKFTREYNTDFQVVFLTPIGKIVCDIAPPASIDALIGVGDDPSDFCVDVSAIFDGLDMFDTQLINARNVIIYKDNAETEFMHLDQMVLFAHQILGFSLQKRGSS